MQLAASHAGDLDDPRAILTTQRMRPPGVRDAISGAVNLTGSSAQGVSVSDPIAAANEYLRVRGPDVGAVVNLGADTVTAQCSNEAPITFGALFGYPTLGQTVTSTSQPIRTQDASGRDIALSPEGTSI